MINIFKILFFTASLFFTAPRLAALDGVNLWRHPEIAEKNAVFLDVGLAPLPLENFLDSFDDFKFLPLDIRADFLPPLSLPFSFGIFLRTPYPNLKHFGLRAAYHFDLRSPRADLYIVYVFDFGFLRNKILAEYNDSPVGVNYFDFRVGIRYFFGSLIGLAAETGFKAESVVFSLSIKIN